MCVCRTLLLIIVSNLKRHHWVLLVNFLSWQRRFWFAATTSHLLTWQYNVTLYVTNFCNTYAQNNNFTLTGEARHPCSAKKRKFDLVPSKNNTSRPRCTWSWTSTCVRDLYFTHGHIFQCPHEKTEQFLHQVSLAALLPSECRLRPIHTTRVHGPWTWVVCIGLYRSVGWRTEPI